MHFCGIIIKKKEIDIKEARELFGEILIKQGSCDWYSTDDYRERTFKNKKEKPLSEFIKIFNKEWATEDNFFWDICIINREDEENYISDYIIRADFYEFYDFVEERKKLLEDYRKLYLKAIDKWFSDLNVDDYTVCLLDYHN